MSKVQIVKVITDILMTVVVFLLMGYSLIGEEVHEWLGISMFILFMMHHIWNRRWIKNLFKGKYTFFRVMQTILVVLVLVSMIGAMASGIVMSRHVFSFLGIKSGISIARIVHLLSSYWSYVFIALHLGLHWNVMMGMFKKMIPIIGKHSRKLAIGIAVLIVGYGIYAVWKRSIISYMLLINTYVFFDFGEPLIYFYLDYIAIMGLFVFSGYYMSKGMRWLDKRNKK